MMACMRSKQHLPSVHAVQRRGRASALAIGCISVPVGVRPGLNCDKSVAAAVGRCYSIVNPKPATKRMAYDSQRRVR